MKILENLFHNHLVVQIIFNKNNGPGFIHNNKISKVFDICFLNQQIVRLLFYKGMLPCFFRGNTATLFSNIENAIISFFRVSFGCITSSINPRAAAR